MTDLPAPRVTVRAVLRNRGFGAFVASKFLAIFSAEILIVAVTWQLWDLTREPFMLGLVGLVEFLPALLLLPLTGVASDRFRRRSIMQLCLVVEAASVGGLLLYTLSGTGAIWPIYLLLAVLAVARAFFAPAQQSLAPNLLPTQHLATGVATSSSAWQLGSISGPAVGGLLLGWSIEVAQAAAAGLMLLAALLILLVPKGARRDRGEPVTWTTVLAGVVFLRRAKVVLGAISLDLFAVLLGGAFVLLPIYAGEIIEIGPEGLGLLRAASGAGALVTAILLAWFPIRDRAGHIMFAAVALFGVFTIVFGLSSIAWLSIGALFLMGAFDMVSVYVRSTLIQLNTPDALRGRVNAVNMVFVGASNELGAFRAGTMAALYGAIPAVVAGGVGCLAVAGLWALWFPQLRRARRLDAPLT
jgi:MFS family permease